MKVRWSGVILVALLVLGTLILKGRIPQHAAPATLKAPPILFFVLIGDV